VFKEEARMYQFQSALLGLVASLSSTKRPYRSISVTEAANDAAATKAEDGEHHDATDDGIFIENETYGSASEIVSLESLERVMRYMYKRAEGEQSLECDQFSDSSIFSAENVNILEAETRVQMLENQDHVFFKDKNPEVAHIKDKAVCPPKEAKDPNNHLHLSRFIHEHFDGINMIPMRTPSFAVHYVSHDDVKVDCPIIGEGAHLVSPRTKRHRVVVGVEFFDEAKKINLMPFFRDGGRWVPEKLTYELELFFEDALLAKRYLDWKVKKTLDIWQDLR